MLSIKKNIFLFLSVIVCFFAVSALFHPGFFPIHDNEQIGRVYELNNSLINLHIPPRLSQNLGFGYDYPFFNFYPSFVYYIAEIFKILGFSFIASVKIMIGLGFVLSALFMYLFSKEYLGKIGALIAATLYVYAPYHSVDVYVRGALPEFWSFVFVPALFWAVQRIYKNPTVGNILLFSAVGFCLIYTHNLIAMMAGLFFILYFLYLLFQSNKPKDFAFSVIMASILAGLISAFFALPAVLENKYTMVNLLTTQLANYKLHFVSIPQFFNSEWGYGGSILGSKDGFSLEVGKLHLMLVAISIFALALLWIKKKKPNPVFWLFTGLLVFSLFMQSYYSKSVWEAIQPFSYIQFPWRFMLFSVFTASFLGGYIFSINFDKRVKTALAILVLGFILLFYSGLFRPSKYLTNVKDSDYTSQKVLRWKTSAMAFEYVPKGISTRTSSLGTTIVDINENEVAQGSAKATTGSMIIHTIIDKPQYKKLQVFALNPGTLQLNTFSFPGWQVLLNGNKIVYNDQNRLKLISINLPKGESLVEARFESTPIRRSSQWLSLLGMIVFVFLLPFSRRKIEL